jgi:hypothetical protein
MTHDALASAKSNAQIIGWEGEAIVYSWLFDQARNALLLEPSWIARDNAINPWDIEYTDSDGLLVRVEVKSTRGTFDRTLHISQAELEAASAEDAPRTDLYRVYQLEGEHAELRIARNIGPLARNILDISEGLGADVTPDGYSIRVTAFDDWSEPLELVVKDDSEEY